MQQQLVDLAITRHPRYRFLVKIWARSAGGNLSNFSQQTHNLMLVALWSMSGTIISMKGGPGDSSEEATFELGLGLWKEFGQ